MVAAALLSMGSAPLDDVAVCAIVVGIFLQLVCFLKCNERNCEKINESS
jgi:hypothetical protein